MGRAEYEAMLARYESLKRQYFGRTRYGDQQDEDYEDDTPPSSASRAQIAQMFENMGVEIPVHPSDPMRQLPQRDRQR